MRTLTILGDSYSTFAGYNPAGQDLYYPNAELGVTDVTHTWWSVLCGNHGLTLLKNDSWSGATVCTSVRPNHPDSAAFVRRMEVTLNGDNQPDVAILLGGTNDSWTDAPIGTLDGEDESQVLPAFRRMVEYVKAHNPKAHVIVVVNSELKDEITLGEREAAERCGATCVMLHDIDKEWGHPTALGMRQIAGQIGEVL